MALQVCSLSGSVLASFEADELKEGELNTLVKERLAPVCGVPCFRLRLLGAGTALGHGTWQDLACPENLQVVVLEYCEKKAKALWNAAEAGNVESLLRILELPQDPNVLVSFQSDDDETGTEEEEEGEEEEEVEEEEEEEDAYIAPFGPTAPALWAAAGRGHSEAVRLLLLAHANTDAVHSSLRSTPLHEAAENGRVVAVRHLLEARASVSKTSCFGRTALICASGGCDEEAVRLLVCAKADVDIKDVKGCTALMACLCNLSDFPAHKDAAAEVVRTLLEANASLDEADRTHRHALGLAAHVGSLPIIESLLGARADVNGTDMFGQSALWRAAADGHLPVVQRLLEAAASLETCDEHGVSAMVMAASRGEVHVVDFLIEKRANLQSLDLKGRNAYWYAAENDETEMAQHLLELGVKPAGETAVETLVAESSGTPRANPILEFPMEGP